MSELLIPFGIHKITGEIVEPEDAPKGRACNCLCPGCKAPLLSRHPKEKRYHFAHDSRHKDAKPEEECPFNSAVAVAMMVREVAVQLVGEVLETPLLEVTEYHACCGNSELLQVSRGASNTIDKAQASVKVFDHHVDLLLEVGGYPILVDLVYKGKLPIMIDEGKLQDNKAALLTLNCDSFSISSLKKDRNLRFSEAVLAFVLREGLRDWAFHPKTASLLHQARRDHQCFKADRRGYSSGWSGHFNPVVPAKQKLQTIKREPVRFQCVMCGVEWVHDFSQGLRCPKCQSHLFARELS
ncbi:MULTISPECIES: hypothetical protein [unclassified Ketobacter]|uniref:hypothetical protein n=1 Tax=unclassified Ketobacter TaxID=2639109 RepID=UPI000F11DC91|nr:MULTISPECIES: hypothetical protein [unclassified Ketobacter]RLT87701.1 MAG: hypothetical protein D9N13_21740 [Ketobacter sp. GenoA1]RLT96634.1 MAG: hypothetical protein D9N15_11025 [Ketobacter sp.]